MLHRQPSKRMSAELAATVCQLYLWAPRSWIDPESPSYPNTQDILQVFASKVVADLNRSFPLKNVAVLLEFKNWHSVCLLSHTNYQQL
jgi:hypothetical protein